MNPPLLLATALLVVSPSGPIGDDPPPVVGHWLGDLDLGPAKLPLVLHVEQGDDGALIGRLDSPDQGAFGIVADAVTFDGRSLRVEVARIAARFEAELSVDGGALSGTFTQAGRATPLALARVAADAVPRPAEAPEVLLGIWQGPIELPLGQSLRVALRVEPEEGRPESRRPFFDSIDQDVRGIPVTAVSVEGRSVRFEVKSIGGSFEGTFDEGRTRIEGRWTQSLLSLPLTLEKVEAVAALSRPQHPEPPFPYRVEEVTFENPGAGITLAGTLTIPEGPGPFPAAVLVSGSGPQDRDETLLGHKPFLVIADHLTRSGIAVLRFDDRGVGRSGGDHEAATTEDFAADALAAVRFLRDREEVDRGAVGIVGHSEGGVVGPIAAAEAPEEVAFLVLLAGTGVPGREVLLRQTALIGRASGLPEALVEGQLTALAALTARVASGEDGDPDAEQLEAIARRAFEALDPEQRAALEGSDAALSRSLDALRGHWFRFFLTYDPRTALRRVRCPVLALFGEKDLQVDPEQNAPEVEAALREAGNAASEVAVLPGLNHLFQRAETGSPAEYGVIEQTIAPEALERIASWIRSRAGRPEAR